MIELTDADVFLDLDAWANCDVPDCQHKRCVWADSPHCFPHTLHRLGEAEMRRRFEDTHPQTWDEFMAGK